MKTDDKMVIKPSHYISKNGLETIDVIEAWIEGLPPVEAFLSGQVIKYISRWNKKNGVQDLEKAQFYLERLIDKLKGKSDAEVEDSVVENNSISYCKSFEDGVHIPLPEDDIKAGDYIDVNPSVTMRKEDLEALGRMGPGPYKVYSVLRGNNEIILENFPVRCFSKHLFKKVNAEDK